VSWEAPAGGFSKVDVSAWVSDTWSEWYVELDGAFLGMISNPSPLVLPRTWPVVASEWGPEFGGAQIELESVPISGATFPADISLARSGWLEVEAEPVSEFLQYAKVRAVSADDATVVVVETELGFGIEIPATASVAAPVHLRFELALPDDFQDGPVVGLDAGFLCTDGQDLEDDLLVDCGSGRRISAKLPLEP
jgi:hypothetical protein